MRRLAQATFVMAATMAGAPASADGPKIVHCVAKGWMNIPPPGKAIAFTESEYYRINPESIQAYSQYSKSFTANLCAVEGFKCIIHDDIYEFTLIIPNKGGNGSSFVSSHLIDTRGGNYRVEVTAFGLPTRTMAGTCEQSASPETSRQ